MSYDPMRDDVDDWMAWPIFCVECGSDVTDGREDSHEVVCSRHPDYRPDLEDVPHPAEQVA